MNLKISQGCTREMAQVREVSEDQRNNGGKDVSLGGDLTGFCTTTVSSELSVYPSTLHQAYTSGHSVMKDVLSLSVLIFCMLLPLYSVHNIRTICLMLRPFFFIWSS